MKFIKKDLLYYFETITVVPLDYFKFDVDRKLGKWFAVRDNILDIAYFKEEQNAIDFKNSYIIKKIK